MRFNQRARKLAWTPCVFPMTGVISALPVNHRVRLSLRNVILKIRSRVNDHRSLWDKLLSSMIRLRLNVTLIDLQNIIWEAELTQAHMHFHQSAVCIHKCWLCVQVWLAATVLSTGLPRAVTITVFSPVCTLRLFSHESKVRNFNYHLNCAFWMIIRKMVFWTVCTPYYIAMRRLKCAFQTTVRRCFLVTHLANHAAKSQYECPDL